MIPIVRTYRSLPNLIDEFLKDDVFGGKTEGRVRYSSPAANVMETETGYNIEIAAPGLERSDIKVTIDNKVLTISSSKTEKKEDKKSTYLKKEFGFDSFSRSFELPENVDVEKIEASHTNGVLSISIPKKAVVQIPVHEVEVK
jgi:HSP20 family protein